MSSPSAVGPEGPDPAAGGLEVPPSAAPDSTAPPSAPPPSAAPDSTPPAGSPSAGRVLHVVAFAGSLRRASFNRALLRAAVEETPEGMELEILDVSEVPVFNADLEADPPLAVIRFHAAIAAADGVLISTPEYNSGLSGVTKNLVDWASRPPGRAAILHKPVAIMGATRGNWGTVRAQAQLRQTLSHIPAHDLKKPEVMVPHAPDKFDEQGRLTDEATRRRLRELLTALGEWILQLERGRGAG